MAKKTGKANDLVLFLMTVDRDKLWDLSEHKETRTLSQNAYFHRLVGLLAKGEQAAFSRKKNELIMAYGVHEFLRDKNGDLLIEYLPDNDDYKNHETKHYYPTQYGGEVRGVTVRAFLLLIGTHQYTTTDFVHLLECTRNECLGADIPIEEVETLEEKRLMQELRKRADAEKNKGGSNKPRDTGKS